MDQEKEIKDQKPRPISACGTDKDGTRCTWTGFDKDSDEIYGIPKNDFTKIPNLRKNQRRL